VLVEVGKESGAASDLVPVNIDHLDEPILRDASLAVRPPAECGACLLDYGAPTEAGDDDAPATEDVATRPSDAP
jgi:hypothetical protein